MAIEAWPHQSELKRGAFAAPLISGRFVREAGSAGPVRGPTIDWPDWLEADLHSLRSEGQLRAQLSNAARCFNVSYGAAAISIDRVNWPIGLC